MSDMIQRCPYTPVTALLLHDLKQEMLAAWPACHEPSSPAAARTAATWSASAAPSSAKGPFLTFGASLLLDTVVAGLAAARALALVLAFAAPPQAA
jgi:hypothetical protein